MWRMSGILFTYIGVGKRFTSTNKGFKTIRLYLNDLEALLHTFFDKYV